MCAWLSFGFNEVVTFRNRKKGEYWANLFILNSILSLFSFQFRKLLHGNRSKRIFFFRNQKTKASIMAFVILSKTRHKIIKNTYNFLCLFNKFHFWMSENNWNQNIIELTHESNDSKLNNYCFVSLGQFIYLNIKIRNRCGKIAIKIVYMLERIKKCLKV